MTPKAHGFSRAERLRRKRDFDVVFEDGRVFRGRRLLVRARPNRLPDSRLGIMIARQFGNSVRRNYVRRLIREAFRLNKPLLGPGLDVVVSLTRGWKEASFREIEADWRRLAPRIRKHFSDEMAPDFVD